MQNPFLYPGKGQILRQVASETDPTPADPDMSNTVIEAGEYSEWIGVHDCLEASFMAEFEEAATGDFIVQRKGPDANDDFDTQTLTAANVYEWRAGEALAGEFRVFNDTDKDMLVLYCQKRIN